MRRIFKRLISVCSIALITAIAGCGGGSGNSGDSIDDTPVPQPTTSSFTVSVSAVDVRHVATQAEIAVDVSQLTNTLTLASE
ncbi:hypothetical protein [Alteromonas sp. KUL49]|uniref:hypothetical protein n=1 Tax=Alteromonas sp. KUL49 TaxID=2480798 RepID=UPI00102EED1F|nr:hypothetical protein [Alteromonas sp. KUL49]TAP40113.1 hypothetical protein EYS00_07985 [Alteromonas sp. KUL49]GEA11225.1 hypothetical protein KUL49_16000 [Alteromonas sp. KUL49]